MRILPGMACRTLPLFLPLLCLKHLPTTYCNPETSTGPCMRSYTVTTPPLMAYRHYQVAPSCYRLSCHNSKRNFRTLSLMPIHRRSSRFRSLKRFCTRLASRSARPIASGLPPGASARLAPKHYAISFTRGADGDEDTVPPSGMGVLG